MENNKNVSYSKFYSELEECALTLKYTLLLNTSESDFFKNCPKIDITPLLDFSSSEYPCINLWFNHINETIFSRCSDFLPDGQHDFFGLIQKQDGKQKEAQKADLRILNQFHHINNSWKFMLFQHAVFSAYRKLRQLFGDNNPLSAYKALQYSQKNVFVENDEKNEMNNLIGLDYVI